MTEQNTNNDHTGQSWSAPRCQGPAPGAPTQQAPYHHAPHAAGPAPAAPQSVPYPYQPAPLMHLTGGMKFGWLVVGFFLGIAGIVLAWLVNLDKAPGVKDEAIKWSAIGFVIVIALSIICGLIIGGIIAAAVSGMMSYGPHSYSYGGVL